MNQFTASLWGDEAFSAVLSAKSVPEILKIIARDTSPPLYNLTEHFWFQIFGSSEIAIRSLSFLYFSLALVFVYLIGSYLWNKKVGLWAALLTFLNPFFFTYAFEGRMYSILALGVTASMYFFIRKKWLGYILATIFALYCHHFAIFAVFTQGLWFLYIWLRGDRKTAWNIFKSFIAIILLYSAWLWPLYQQTKMVGGGFWLGKPTLIDLLILIAKYLAVGVNNKLTIPALVLTLVGLLSRKWLTDKSKTIFLLAWFLVPIGVTWLISQKFTSIFFDRYLLYTIPAGVLILVSNQRRFSKILLIGLSLLFIVIDVNYFTHPTKRPFRELATYIKSVEKPGDFLLNWNSAAHHLWESKYYGIPAPIYLPEGSLPYFVGTALMTKEDTISKIPTKTSRLGVITSGPEAEVKISGFKKLDSQAFGPLTFIIFTPQRAR